MATRTPTITDVPAVAGVTAVWTGLLNGDDGTGVDTGRYADRTFQVTGTFGTGGSITMQGSNDNTNWFTLTSQVGAALTFVGAGGGVAAEAPRWVRPIVTAGDGSTSLTVRMIAR